MKTSRLASVALAGAVLLGTTGCTFITPQATEIEYHAADGVGLDVGALEIRDALVVADDSGTDGNFVAAVVNSSDEDQTLRLEFGPEGGTTTERIRVGAGETLTLGHDGTDPLLLSGIDTPPGAMISIYFSSGEEAGSLTLVPVLGGELPYYAPLVP